MIVAVVRGPLPPWNDIMISVIILIHHQFYRPNQTLYRFEVREHDHTLLTFLCPMIRSPCWRTLHIKTFSPFWGRIMQEHGSAFSVIILCFMWINMNTFGRFIQKMALTPFLREWWKAKRKNMIEAVCDLTLWDRWKMIDYRPAFFSHNSLFLDPVSDMYL